MPFKGAAATVWSHFLPFGDRSFDTVVSLGALEHFATPEVALAEMSRVLRTDGRFVLTFNSRASRMYLLLEGALMIWGRMRGGRFVPQPTDGRLRASWVADVLLKNRLRVILAGTYSIETLGFGRFQSLALKMLPQSWRTTPCVHFFYCKKGDFGKEAEYGPFFPRR